MQERFGPMRNSTALMFAISLTFNILIGVAFVIPIFNGYSVCVPFTASTGPFGVIACKAEPPQ